MKDYPSHLFEHAIPKRNHQQKKASNKQKKNPSGLNISCVLNRVGFCCSEWLKSNHDMRTKHNTVHTENVQCNQHESRNEPTPKLGTTFCSRFCTNWTRHKFMLMSFQVVPQRIPVTNDLQRHEHRDTREREHSHTQNGKRRAKQSHRICST